VREIRTLRAMWRALETGSSLKIYAPALDPTKTICSIRESAKPSRPVSSIQLDIYCRAELFSHSWL
jgi:hypothetical protein